MTTFSARTTRVAILVVLAIASNGASAAPESPVYKCGRANGAVLYTDFPCEGGEALDIKPGRADPAAASRLEAARAELALGAERVKAERAMIAARREEFELLRRADEPPPTVAGAFIDYPVNTYGTVGGYGYPPSFRGPPRFHGKPHDVKPFGRHVGTVPARIHRPSRSR